VSVGSVREEPLSRIWNSTALEQERKRLSCDRTCRCWYNNTALIGHFGTLIKNTIPSRVLKSKHPAVSPGAQRLGKRSIFTDR